MTVLVLLENKLKTIECWLYRSDLWAYWT